MEPRALTPYVLQMLARHQLNGRRVHLQTVVDELKIRRGDVRKTITALYLQGYLDLASLRLTMTGFTIGMSLLDSSLPPLRRVSTSAEAA